MWRSHARGWWRCRLRLAENTKRSQLIIATTSGVGRILESDILGIAAMNCNDGSVKDFVGYKYPTTLATVAVIIDQD